MTSDDICYVCFEACHTYSQCKCRGLIHDACLLKSIEMRGFSGVCSICGAPFANVLITKPVIKRRLHRRTKCLLTAGFALVIEASLAVHFYTCIATDNSNSATYLIVFVMSLISAFAAILLAFLVCVRARRRAEPWLEQWVGSARVALVPVAQPASRPTGELCA